MAAILAAPVGARLFARAVKPHLLELAAAPDMADLEDTGVTAFSFK